MKRIIINITVCLAILVLAEGESSAATIYAGAGQRFSTIKEGLAACVDGDTLVVRAGVYREGNIIIDKSVFLIGEGLPLLDGEFSNEILSVKANNVVIKGLRLHNSGRSTLNDPGAVKVYDALHVTIEDNELQDNFFGIYIQYGKHCVIRNNIIKASQREEYLSGNGIHCWKSDSLQIVGNVIEGHRDGIYFEFVTYSVIWRNIAKNNLRYGLHFMFSNNDAYISNYFKNNGAGVAVMFTKKVTMLNNTFEESRGDAAYGVLFKEISDCYLSGNRFLKNTTGIFLDGSNRVIMENNLLQANGWALRIQANCIDNMISHNNFIGNTFDVSTNGSLTLNKFSENYWDKYEGYDLDKDGVGDVPYRPLSLYSVIVEKNPPAMLLYRSFMIGLLDKSEKLLPSLTPENFIDNTPRMKPYTP